MTREDVVRLWDQANNWGIPIRSELVDELKRFADLVATAEREACAKVCEKIKGVKLQGHEFASVIRARGGK